MDIKAPKLLEFKKKYSINIKKKENIKSHTYSIHQYKNSFNKLKMNYNKKRSNTLQCVKDIRENQYNRLKFYYGSNIDNYKNTHNYHRDSEFNGFNKKKYYYNVDVGDNKDYMTKEKCIKEELDETIENRFITIFLLHIWNNVVGLI